MNYSIDGIVTMDSMFGSKAKQLTTTNNINAKQTEDLNTKKKVKQRKKNQGRLKKSSLR